jgi:Protein of unknown function (DUF1329)
MYKKIVMLFSILLIAALAVTPFGMAKVTPEEAARLGKDLTPWGAEKAGNAAGTIPAWDGGIATPPAGYGGTGSLYVDPFADDKVLFAITAKNVDQYADKLNEGQIALFKRYPDTYRIDVYPSRRSHALPQWVMENTLKNATRAVTPDDGTGLSGAYGGIPFPIPKSGVEVMWNHKMRYMGSGSEMKYAGNMIHTNGSISVGEAGDLQRLSPYYDKDGSLETFEGGFFYGMYPTYAPARKNGEVLLLKRHVTSSHKVQAWIYFVGQRRVRRAPTFGFDTPTTSLSGHYSLDDYYGFMGSMERFDWKLVGKKELFIPYNSYKTEEKVGSMQGLSKLYPVKHQNPDYFRYELHRVWEVEATLKEGERHIYGRRVYYIDEDSWSIVLKDAYDGRGELWRTQVLNSYNAYELPGVIQRTMIMLDLRTDEYCVTPNQNYFEGMAKFDNPKPEKYFTVQTLRRLGKR